MVEKYSIIKKEEVYILLKNKRNFEYMSEPLLRRLIDVMKVVRFREERWLIKQGSENTNFYIIIKGSVSVYVDGKFLYKLKRTGDVIGEISFVTKSISTASIKADKDLGVIAVSYNFLNRLQSVELCLWLARVIGEKLIRTSKIKSGLETEEAFPADDARHMEIPDLLTETDEISSTTNDLGQISEEGVSNANEQFDTITHPDPEEPDIEETVEI
jgi:CRP-like cAMP-binding protein